MYHSDEPTTEGQLYDYEQMSRQMKVDSVKYMLLWFACAAAVIWMIATERGGWPFVAMFALKIYVFWKILDCTMEAEHSGFHAKQLREELDDAKPTSD